MTKMRLPPIGFWSYARSDDFLSEGHLTRLRELVKRELQLQFGRDDVRLFQDSETIPYGDEWEKRILAALNESTFFIPIITPSFIESEWCNREAQLFLERERVLLAQYPDLPRHSRIFPIDYRKIRNGLALKPDILAELGKRQWCDFRELRNEELAAKPVRAKVEEFAESICDLLFLEVETPPTPEEIARERAEEVAARKLTETVTRKAAAAARWKEATDLKPHGAEEDKARLAAAAAKARAEEDTDRRHEVLAPEVKAVKSTLPAAAEEIRPQQTGPHVSTDISKGRRRKAGGLAATLLGISTLALVAMFGLPRTHSDAAPNNAAVAGAENSMMQAAADLGNRTDNLVNGPDQTVPSPSSRRAEDPSGSAPIRSRPSVASRTPAPTAPLVWQAPVVVGAASIQLGLFSRAASAEAAWNSLSGRYSYLSRLSHRVTELQVGGRTAYRLRAYGFGVQEACRRLQAAGEACTEVN